jgi:hypothetical protein
MLRERKPGSDGTSTAAATSNNNNIITDDDANNANSAGATAISCRSEQDLRVACFCEENVWRLAYRRLFGASSLSTASSSSSSSSSVLQLTNSSTIDKENEEYYVVFVSNDEKCCPMLNQKASRHVDEPCFWDYHVILIQCSKQQKLNQYHHLKENNNNNNNNNTNENENAIMTQVLDMDSRLSYPCPLDEYLNETFSKLEFVDVKATKKYAPKFRVIRAELYLKNFYSDRMHMFHNGKWSSTPPSYDCILTTDGGMKMKKGGKKSNLNDYISMSTTNTSINTNGGKGKELSPMGQVLTMQEMRAKFGQQL